MRARASARRQAPRGQATCGAAVRTPSVRLLSLLVAGGLALAGEPAATAATFARGVPVSGIACQSDPTQTYTLYLPSSYTPERRWPTLLVLDPGGRGDLGAERFRAAAEEHGWVLLSSNNVHSDGTVEANQRALAAMWNEVQVRVASDPRRIYAAGFSGGGILAYALGYGTGNIAGVIVSGGRFRPGDDSKPLHFPCFGAAGDEDFNYLEMHDVHRVLARWGTPERLEIFDGTHEWLPEPMVRRAVDWLELHAARQGLRPADPALLDRFVAADLAAVAELETAGRPLDAADRLRLLAADLALFRPGTEVTELGLRADRLAALPAARQELAERRRWDLEEVGALKRFSAAAAEILRDDGPPVGQRFETALGIGELTKRAGQPGYAGVSARRLLATHFMRCATMLGPQMLNQGDAAKAAVFFQAASRIAPERWVPRYNLACALARAGSRRPALEALEKAVELGFADAAAMNADRDLTSLHEEPRYAALLAKLQARLQAARPTTP